MSKPEDEATIVPIFKTIPSEVEKLLAKLREKLVETGKLEELEESDIELIITLQNTFLEITSSTTSDVIISPFVAEQTILADALVMSSVINTLIQTKIIEFRRHLNDNNIYEAIKSLRESLKLKEIAFKAMILSLKKKLTHIYVNMPSKIRPSLATAMIGYDVIEQ
ncbi:MAG: hypothetical protein QXK24_01255 [Ignisphaera sp.]